VPENSTVIREKKESVFGEEAEGTAEGKTLKEKMAMLQNNMKNVSKVQMKKRLSRQEQTLRSAPTLTKEERAERTKMVQAVVGRRMSQQKAITDAEAGLFDDEEEEEKEEMEDIKENEGNSEGSTIVKSQEKVKAPKPKKAPKMDINKNNNAQIFARLTDKKKEEAYRKFVKMCKTAKIFSATNNLLDDRFIEVLVEGALKPEDPLEQLILESNKIGNRGLSMLAKAIPHLKNLHTIRLRNQSVKASVPVQKLLLDAIDANENITKIGVDVTNDQNRRRMNDISMKHSEIKRKKRLAARAAK